MRQKMQAKFKTIKSALVPKTTLTYILS